MQQGIIGALGDFMSRHNLGINLLVLMTFQTTFTDTGNDKQTDVFKFSSMPVDILHSGVYSAGVGTSDALCDVVPSVAFDRANHQFSLKFNHTDFANSASCMAAFDPVHLGYDPIWNGDNFDIIIGKRVGNIALAFSFQ